MAKGQKGKVLRPPGLVVFAMLVVISGLLWWLYADTLVQRSVEATGASIVGAKVDLESADLRAADGSIRLTGLQVTNPDAPMTNLMEAEEITVDLMLEPLLEKKLVIENLVVTGVRFNTPRETSGALENPDSEAGVLWRQVNDWADQIEVPSLSLDGLGGVVNTDALSLDSLRTVQHARALVSRTDSMRTGWEGDLRRLDPRPRIDSLRTVVERMEAFRLTPLNALQVPGLVRDGRGALNNVTSLETEVTQLSETVREGVGSLRAGLDQFGALRTEDLAYARSLLNIPSLEAPSISPALFGGTALTWLKPVLFWAQTAERYLPPGLDPKNRPGPKRARAEGTTVAFPGRATWPSFLLERGEVGLAIAGVGAAAGLYTAQVRDLSTAPSLVGRPMEIRIGREEGSVGPRGLQLAAVLDHTTAVLRDSVSFSMSGVSLPELSLEAFGGRVSLGEGDTRFDLARIGDQIEANMSWVSNDLIWSRMGSPSGGAVSGDSAAASTARLGSAEWARDLVWRTLSGLGRVELHMGLSGAIEHPSLSVSSNLGEAVATSLRRELGREIEAAEARVRQEVDRQIQPLVQDARGRVDAVRTEVFDRVEAQRQEVEELRTRLQSRLRELTPGGAGPDYPPPVSR